MPVEIGVKKFEIWMSSTMPETDEQQGLKRLQALDAKTIGAVYDQYFSEVYRYVLYRVGDQTLAEDIASDVFVRLLEAAEKGNAPRSSLKGWLMSTASHVVADHLRRKYRRPEEEISDSIPDQGPSLAAEVDQREQNRVVNDAYARLTAEQQHVLALRFGQGYSLEETATFMDRNVNAVKALQFRALAALQRGLGEVNYE
jgi:RNA polymerase sigma-70 factor (ECF subfamily)